jgi:hypothetical protein
VSWRRSLLVVVAALSATRGDAAPPWEDLLHLAELPALRFGEQVLLRSSFCPGGCRFDRTSEGDTRFLRIENGEAVIFDEAGAGAIARIWVTMGPGVSEPIDPTVRIRVRLDGSSSPAIDLALADLFRGDVAPFVTPLVADRLVSSGGNVSYVPIPYRKGCVVSLVGAEKVRIWYQITFHRLASAEGVTTFSGDEDLSPWIHRLQSAGTSPWPDDGVRRERRVRIPAGGTRTIFSATNGGTLREIRLRAGDAIGTPYTQFDLRITADGSVRVAMPLADFFAAPTGSGSPPSATPQRTVLLGEDDAGFLYSFYPMPFSAGLKVELVSRAASPVRFDTRFDYSAQRPPPHHGIFEARLRVSSPSPIGRDLVLADVAGAGKWVGLAASVASVGTLSREILEGDERVFVDGALTPAHYGTGVEDLFNGGFYFDRGPFRAPLHGVPEHFVNARGEDVTRMLRLLLSDAVPFRNRLRIGLEGGPTNNLAMRVRAVTYVYVERPGAAALTTLRVADRFVVGDAASRLAHDDRAPSDRTCSGFESAFESEPPVTRTAIACRTRSGPTRFVLRRAERSGALRIRRRVDASLGGQSADVFVDGRWVAAFPVVATNALRRFHETDVDLPPGTAAGQRALRLEIRPRGLGGTAEISYELWSEAARR